MASRCLIQNVYFVSFFFFFIAIINKWLSAHVLFHSKSFFFAFTSQYGRR